MDSFVLPDGKVAESAKDVDEYLKRSGMALSGDYSPEYLKRKREEREKAQSDEIRADFVQSRFRGCKDSRGNKDHK